MLAALAAVGAGQPAAAAEIEYSVAEIEVNQAIQKGTTPLVAGRPTFVRVRVNVADLAFRIDGLLRVFVDGVEAPFSPVFSSNGPYFAFKNPNLNSVDGTLNFVFIAPESDDVVLTVHVNPPGPNQLPETNPDDNTASTGPLSFGYQRVAEIAYAPIDYRPSGGSTPNLPSPSLIEPGVGDNFVQGIYPTPDWYYHRTDAPSKLWTSSLEQGSGSLLNSLFFDLLSMSPRPDFIYGWVPGALPYNGQASLGGDTGVGNTQTFRHQRTFAHELGHNFGLPHNNLSIVHVGVDVEHHLNETEMLDQAKPGSLKDIMAAGLATSQAWVHSSSYQFFRNHPVFDGGAPLVAPHAGPTLAVAGLWNDETGAIETTGLLRLEGGEPTVGAPLEEADLVVRAWSGGERVHELPLALGDGLRECGGCLGRATAADVAPLRPFTAVLAEQPGRPIDRLEIADRSAATDAPPRVVLRSPAAPVVAFRSPGSGALAAERLAVEWEGRDADGDELAYYLRYSPDGERLVPLASGVAATRLDVDLGRLPRMVDGAAYFELLASDGLNTTRLRSEPLHATGQFQSGGNPPWVQVLTPDAGKRFPFGATVILHASGWDLEDRGLDGASLVWSSDLDGVLGTGRLLAVPDLSVGSHVLTVQAMDSDSRVATATTVVGVTARDLPFLGTCQADLGSAGPGSSTLAMCGGDLSTGTTADLILTGAVPNQAAWILGGPASNPVPLLGGTIVPFPTPVQIPLATDATGGFVIEDVAGGGGPLTFYLQAIHLDAGQPEGFGISNALELQFLP